MTFFKVGEEYYRTPIGNHTQSIELYYVWCPWLTSKRVARVCQHQLSFLFNSGVTVACTVSEAGMRSRLLLVTKIQSRRHDGLFYNLPGRCNGKRHSHSSHFLTLWVVNDVGSSDVRDVSLALTLTLAWPGQLTTALALLIKALALLFLALALVIGGLTSHVCVSRSCSKRACSNYQYWVIYTYSIFWYE